MNEAGTAATLDIPSYDVRRALVAKDPWAVVQAFGISIRYMLPRLLGCRMCPLCPHCNVGRDHSACANKFGHNFLPMGGVAGLAAGFGGSVEYQLNDNPHFHGNAHLVSMYQYMSLHEIAELMQQNWVTLHDVAQWQAWVCREDHFDLDAHTNAQATLEKSWSIHNSDTSSHGLCSLPPYLQCQAPVSLWSTDKPPTLVQAQAEAAQFKSAYHADAQYVFSRCHHHWHPTDAKTGKRMPIRGCKAKTGGGCKARFPMTRKCTLKPKVICGGNCRRHEMRVAGRRNALGSILTTRREGWMSGTAPAFAVMFRHNTHTAPNYRVPLLPETHDPSCKAGCLTKHSLTQMTAAAQRGQRNTTGYYTG